MGRLEVTYVLYASIQFDPSACCAVLRSRLPTANQLVKLAFQSIFNLGVPRRSLVGFRLEILDRLGAAEFKWNQMIDLVISTLINEM
jgi:hypothetical protein